MTLTGGYLRDMPAPHVRKWPDTIGHGEKRCLDIQVSRYEVSIVKHYHVSWGQEANPIWDSRTRAEESPEWAGIQGAPYGDKVVGWHVFWDDEEGKGKTGHDFETTTRMAMVELVADVAAQFPDHRISVNYIAYDEWLREMQVTGPDQYYYKRDGA